MIGGQPVGATIFDMVVYAFHNYENLKKLGQSCYFYLSKVQSMEEAMFYGDVLSELERHLNLPAHSFKVSLICESVQACFELDEILHALRHRITAVASGRWNYLTSLIKRFQSNAQAALPARNHIPFDAPFLLSYMRHIVNVSHRRNCIAIAGASNIVPRMGDKSATIEAKKGLEQEKQFEAETLGFDGAWVVHPLMVEQTRRNFGRRVDRTNSD
jgi:malate synthase